MILNIYNNLTRQKEKFKPLVPQQVSMYVCGPTVYDYIHIGNARPLIFFDVVRKYLQKQQYDVRYIVNFTDVDDKLITKAAETGMTVQEVADKFITAYFEDARALGVQDADVHPRVTDYITEIVQFIQGLMDKGYAYEAGGDVYFRSSKFAEYGKLSQQNLEQLQHGARIDINDNKEEPIDFVLWKKAKEGEVSWSSPWGEGRPGWHMECSAMVKALLGVTIDIHGGGLDLQFPHHECEIAQSEALHDQPLANYWMHNGYIHIDDEKMSKSLGNGILVNQLLQQVRPEVVRFFMLSTHYRNPLNMSDESLAQSEQSLTRIDHSFNNLRHRIQNEQAASSNSGADTEVTKTPSDDLFENIAQLQQAFDEKMADDFNTADAITVLFDLVALTNRYLKEIHVSLPHLKRIEQLFLYMNDVLGIIKLESDMMLAEEVERLIAERTEARANKDWARADEIRDALQAEGIILEDTAQGMRWRRK